MCRKTRKQFVAISISFYSKRDTLSRLLPLPVFLNRDAGEENEEGEGETPDGDESDHADGCAAGAGVPHFKEAEVLEEDGEFDESGAGGIVEVGGEDILGWLG